MEVGLIGILYEASSTTDATCDVYALNLYPINSRIEKWIYVSWSRICFVWFL